MLVVDPYPYQNEAIDKALDRGNLLIAYGMGLGKTLVQMGICEELIGEGEVDVNAIVVPASLKWQWAQALVWATDVPRRTIFLKRQKITVPSLYHAVVIDGNPDRRVEQYRFIRRHRPQYVILGYDNVVNDWRYIQWIKPDLIALDEATAIKSFQAERSKKVKEWWAPFRYALTGTPIDNRADELYSIMEWVSPGELGSQLVFDKSYVRRNGYGKIKGYKNLDVLHKKIQPFVARKTRFDPDVAPFMPKDVHRETYVELTGKTKKMYDRIAGDLADRLEEIVSYGVFDVAAYYAGEASGRADPAQGEAMAMFGALQMLCDHPRLLVESAEKYERWFNAAAAADEEDTVPKSSGSAYAYSLLENGDLDWIDEKTTSPKFEAVLEEVGNLLDEREENKIIIFSFSKLMLRIFQERLPQGSSVIFDGDMNASQKEEAKQRFKRDPEVRVFLSSDAGGMGVDLPEANYLINYNHPWSAGKADQRNSRHVRAGSKWDEVWILNFIVSGSVEEWKFRVLELKRRVGSAILDGGPTKDGHIAFDAGSLLEFLR